MSEAITSKWFIATVAYGNSESAKREKVTYCVAAATFTECERVIAARLSGVPSVEVLAAAVAPFKDVCLGEGDGRFYKLAARYRELDENTGKPKYRKYLCLVQAKRVDFVHIEATRTLETGGADYEIIGVTATPIFDVFTK